MLFLFFLIVIPAFAQVTTGSISGYVFDPNRGVVANAEVVARDGSRGFERRVQTDRSGFYIVGELAPAVYNVSASAQDFGPSDGREIRVEVNSRARLDFTLALAARKESIEVKQAAQAVQTETFELGEVIDQSRIQGLPLNRRDFLQLALLTPGVLPAVQNSELSQRGGFALNANGAREEFNDFLIDGVDNNDPYERSYVLQPPVDSIQEFKIATNSYSAEYGRGAGAQINLVTRSGSNDWHGSAYEYLRNRALDARNFFDGADKPKYIRNQFGAGAGGPIRYNRTFFFLNFDELRERRGLTRLATVPTLEERAGDLSALNKNIVDPFTRKPFPGNQIPQAR
ncbi:MAG: TonB-dependent receptor, partial [Bryobacterales bacterium]|nr:TonB-dependent receptor [Bryobacterales bacterium]